MRDVFIMVLFVMIIIFGVCDIVSDNKINKKIEELQETVERLDKNQKNIHANVVDLFEQHVKLAKDVLDLSKDNVENREWLLKLITPKQAEKTYRR